MDEKRPQTRMGNMPTWCHHHCSKMRLVFVSLMNDMLILQGSAAELIIQRLGTGWLVKWRVIQSREGQVSGQTVFSHDDLFHAFFTVTALIPKTAEWLIDEYGGSTASQGKLIRYGEYLNIPGPGTGHDGDANISIEIDEEMTNAVKKLLYDCRS